GHDVAESLAAVLVHVHDAGHDRLAGGVDAVRAGGHLYAAGGADGGDAVALHDDRAALDDLVAAHGDDARVFEGDGAGRPVGGRAETDVHARGQRQGGELAFRVVDPVERVRHREGVEFRSERPVEAAAVAGPVEVVAGVAG